MTAIKIFGIALLGTFLWTASGFVHESRLIAACERGVHSTKLQHQTHGLQGCTFVKR